MDRYQAKGYNDASVGQYQSSRVRCASLALDNPY